MTWLRVPMSVSSLLPLWHGAAHDDLRDAQRRLRIGHGHPLAVLPARSHSKAEIRPDRVDAAEHLRPTADERRVSNRLGDFPIADHVGLPHVEDEIPAR